CKWLRKSANALCSLKMLSIFRTDWLCIILMCFSFFCMYLLIFSILFMLDCLLIGTLKKALSPVNGTTVNMLALVLVVTSTAQVYTGIVV
ncbi:hypothetical protein ACYCNS_27250, partial [Klebsiella pneumoniae]